MKRTVGAWVTVVLVMTVDMFGQCKHERQAAGIWKLVHQIQSEGAVGVGLRGTRNTDAKLLHLRRVSTLESLTLSHSDVTDVGLVHLQAFKQLQRLDLGDTKISDVGLVHLTRLNSLRALRLSRSDVSDKGLSHLRHLTNLRELELDNTRLHGRGVVHLSRLTKLRRLSLAHSDVSDLCPQYFRKMTHLRVLDLRATKVSQACLKKIQAALSNCWIRHESLKLPKLAEVYGTVTLDGVPLANVKVTFQPKTGRPSIGTTDPAGHYRLEYYSEVKSGAQIGSHTVRVDTAGKGKQDSGVNRT